MTIALVNDSVFDQLVINNPHPTLVTFISPHCPQCSFIGPELETTAQQLPHVNIYACDITESPESRDYFGIDGTPRSILFSNGKEIATLRGFQYSHTIINFIQQHTQ